MKTVTAQDRFDEPVTAEVLEKAIKRSEQRRPQGLHATGVQYLGVLQSVFVYFNHHAIGFPIRDYPELAALNEEELSRLCIGFGGKALCLDSRDLHVSIAGLVQASGELSAAIRTLAAALNGRKRSQDKMAASQANGLKGGRPRKAATS
jgi:hypothetical protein